jgi:hypothetical protein
MWSLIFNMAVYVELLKTNQNLQNIYILFKRRFLNFAISAISMNSPRKPPLAHFKKNCKAWKMLKCLPIPPQGWMTLKWLKGRYYFVLAARIKRWETIAMNKILFVDGEIKQFSPKFISWPKQRCEMWLSTRVVT